MTTRYKILFMIEMLHDFYKDGKCSDFRFVPSAETAAHLRNYHALCKTVGNKFVVLIKTDETGKPFTEIKPEHKFSFLVELMKPLFMTVSNLDLNALAQKRFYFTNLHQNKVTVSAGNDVLYLTRPIEAYNAATAYNPGHLVNAAGTVYECIAATTGNTPATPSAFWADRGLNQYGCTGDLVQFIPNQYSFIVNAAADVMNITVFALNTANNLFDRVVQQQKINFESVQQQVAVDLSSLADGRYKIVINTTAYEVYISNHAVYQNMFAVVDLYAHLSAGNDFAFTDAAGKTKDQIIAAKNVWLNYTIRFANRMAFWKYFTPKKGVVSINSNPDYSFAGNANPADFFTSAKPIPLQEKPHEFKLTLQQAVSTDPPLAPNPDVNASGMLTKNGSNYVCNIYLNY
jgi:hypothetical protein